MADNKDQASMLAAHSLQTLTEHNVQVIKTLLNSNWEDEVETVSHLLQSPILIPEEMRIDCLIRGLEDSEEPYYILSAAIGIQRLKLAEKDINRVLPSLKKAVFSEHGSVCMRVFIASLKYLKFPQDTDLFIQILNVKKSPLHSSALSWLILNVNDKDELVNILKKGEVHDDLVLKAEQNMDAHCRSLSHGNPSPVSIEVIDYIPSFNDFEAMLEKGETLSEFFDDLDTDKDNKLSAEEVKIFLADIGKEVTTDEIIEEMKALGIDDSGKIDKDGFIEMMFPKFQIQ